mgnify:FL=1
MPQSALRIKVTLRVHKFLQWMLQLRRVDNSHSDYKRIMWICLNWECEVLKLIWPKLENSFEYDTQTHELVLTQNVHGQQVYHLCLNVPPHIKEDVT